jgi:hypothetical protein
MDDIDERSDDLADAAPEGLESAVAARHAHAFAPYDRRAPAGAGDPKPRRVWSTLSRAVRVREVVFAIVLLAGTVLGALGFTISTPRTASNALNTRIDTQGAHVTALDRRVDAISARVDTVYQKLDFMIYLQCVQIRRDDPASAPPGCDPVAQMRRRP